MSHTTDLGHETSSWTHVLVCGSSKCAAGPDLHAHLSWAYSGQVIPGGGSNIYTMLEQTEGDNPERQDLLLKIMIKFSVLSFWVWAPLKPNLSRFLSLELSNHLVKEQGKSPLWGRFDCAFCSQVSPEAGQAQAEASSASNISGQQGGSCLKGAPCLTTRPLIFVARKIPRLPQSPYFSY